MTEALAKTLAESLAETLPATLAGAWERLAEGVADRRSPFHTPALATLGLDGRPRLRTVVLREADPAARRLRVHLDRRSEKAAEIARDPRVALHAYDAAGRFQLRVEGTGALHTDDPVADAAWAAARPMSRKTYAVAPGPGTPLPSGDAYDLPDDAEVGRPHFAVLVVTVARIETLGLAREGHRRARFDWDAGGALAMTWLVP